MLVAHCNESSQQLVHSGSWRPTLRKRVLHVSFAPGCALEFQRAADGSTAQTWFTKSNDSRRCCCSAR